MRYVIIILLLIPFTISVGYLLTHPMPSHNVKALEAAFGGKPVTQEHQSSRKENWRMHIFKKAPQAGDAGIPEGNHIKVETDLGSFTFELFPKEAPNTVANFKALAGKGFYDGLTFHRVIAGFVAQGGDPKGNGAGGPGYHVKAEFNAHKHVTGAIAMAHSSDPDSAGSQFYICYGAHPHLDGHYTVFGQITEGQDVVDKITRGTVMKKVSVLP
ncbi:MAG: peptidylprolyl isomerase [Mariprofundaceae bacterium]|nr:peptidylprolyl isomerase [Mariprofundaceae bacterium]